MSGQWQHQFTPIEKPYQIGEADSEDEIKHPIMARKMECVHCHKTFIQGLESYPAEFCPARNDKRELKRIKNMSGGKL